MKDFNREAKEEILICVMEPESKEFTVYEKGKGVCGVDLLKRSGDTVETGVYNIDHEIVTEFIEKALEIKRRESIKIFKELLD